MESAGQFHFEWSWNPFYGYSQSTSALAWTEIIPCKSEGTSTGKLLDSLPRNNVPAELCSGGFKVAYCNDLEGKLPTPPPTLLFISSLPCSVYSKHSFVVPPVYIYYTPHKRFTIISLMWRHMVFFWSIILEMNNTWATIFAIFPRGK
jgi:hypothetical protein